MYYLVKYPSGHIYLMKDVEDGKGLITVLERIRVRSDLGFRVGNLLIPLDLYKEDTEVISGDDEKVLALAAMEVL